MLKRMPYDDKLRAVFLHIPKTGGSCIEILFGFTGMLNCSINKDAPNRSPQHLGCKELKAIIPWRYMNYYKFCFIRNPFDRLVSDYHWCMKSKPERTFEEFVEYVASVVRSKNYSKHLFDDHYVPQVEYIEPGVEIYRFEHFNDEVKRLAKKLNVTLGDIPILNSSSHHHYSEYYTPKTIAIVESIYADDLKLLGYKSPTIRTKI